MASSQGKHHIVDLHSILGNAVGAGATLRSFIDGKFEDSQHDFVLDAVEPATEECLLKIPAGNAQTVDRAVQAAHRAFAEGRWRKMPGSERATYLFEIADLLESRSEALALLESRDTGLPILFTKGGHIPKAISQFRFFAEEATRNSGQVFPLGDAYLNTVMREAAGVVAIITPWNAPLSIAASNLAAAIAVGNCCVLKPSEEASLTSAALAEICQEADLPPGVVNVVFGPGQPTGESLVSHSLVDVISFTGGSSTGERVITHAACGLKRLGLETGGKSATIIFGDADWDSALDGAILSMFANNGEVCAAGSRILVEEKRYEELVEELVSRAKALRVGDPTNATTECGPLISRKHLQWVTRCIAEGEAEGAIVACGGGRPSGCKQGFFIEPTVMVSVNNRMQLAQREIFGPVAAVIPFDGTEQSAIDIANDSRYGLAAYVWSNDWSKAMRVAQGIRAGFVSVNAPLVRDHRAPFGGYKASGIGRMGGNHSLALFTELKTTCLPIRPYHFPRLGTD